MSLKQANEILETIKDYEWTKTTTIVGGDYFMGDYLEAEPSNFFGLKAARIYIYSPNFDPRAMDETVTEPESYIMILHDRATELFEESDYIWTNAGTQVYVGSNMNNQMPEITALFEELWAKPGTLHEVRVSSV